MAAVKWPEELRRQRPALKLNASRPPPQVNPFRVQAPLGSRYKSGGPASATLRFLLPAAMDQLPGEMLTYLFRFFSATERAKSVAPVCSLWRAICQEPQFWKSITLRNSHLNSDQSRYPAYRRVLKQHADHLQTLNLDGCFCDPKTILDDGCFVQLKTIRITYLTEALIEALIMTCPVVEEIEVVYSFFHTDPHTLTRVLQWSSLKRVSISYDVLMSTADSLLLVLVEACTDLERVHLFFGRSAPMNDDSVLQLAQSHHKTLTHLALPCWTVTSMLPLMLCLQLRHLELHLSDQILDQDVATLGRLPNLTHLSLRTSRPSALADLFRACKTLTHVKLRDIPITAAAMHHLATSCLQLQYVWIEDRFLTGEILTPLLDYTKQLRSLYLFWCGRLGEDVIQHIARKLPHLKNVRLGSRLDQTILKQQMPLLNRDQIPSPWFDCGIS